MAATLTELTKLWDKTLKRIKLKLNNEPNFDYFFSNSYIYDLSGNTLIIVAQHEVAKAVIQEKYVKLISECLQELQDEDYELKIITEDEANSKSVKDLQKAKSNEQTVYFADSKVDPNFRFSNFVVGEFNRDAYKAALYVARNGGTMFNPLFIYSHSGLGKTHLLYAIGNDIKENRMPDAKILYINANDFVEEYINYVKAEKDSQSLKGFFKGVDILLLDDVQILAGKVKTEEFFFYVYQQMINAGKRIIITSDKQPNEIKGLEERLVTRFTQGLTISIGQPDIDTCIEILKAKIVQMGLKVEKFDANVLYFLAEKYSRDVRELEGALQKLFFDCMSLDDGETITMDIALKALSSLKGGKFVDTQVDEQRVINVVADYYNLTPSQITGKDRTGQVVLARHISMYLIRKHIDVPLQKIGKTFGGKDHTTVMSAINKVDKELKTDKVLQSAIEDLEKKLKK